jgi:predicted ATP-dependent serine protease
MSKFEKPIAGKKNAVAELPAPERKAFDFTNIFTVKPASQWMQESKHMPIPNMLFGELWFEGEWSILFADSGIGKSILSVQIADAISTGHNNYKELFPVEVKPQPVLYFDYELSSKQFEKRYSRGYTDHFKFSPNFLRVEINKESDNIEDFNNNVYEAIEAALLKHNAKVAIIDNITAMSMYSTDSAKDAIPLINRLMRLKNKYGISLLTLHHTPKRDKSQPITDSNLAGSKMFSNFCDSVFAIGVSGKDEKTKYIKQIKVRSADHQFGSENVIMCSTDKVHNFLQFTFEGTGSERDHLKELSEKEKTEIDSQIMEFLRANPESSLRSIAKDFGVHHSKVDRISKRLKDK